MAKPAVAELQHEDEAVRVTLWRFAPSTETGWHVHEYDYVVVPVQGGTLTVESHAGGRAAYPIRTAVSYARPKGTEHNIINDTDAEIAFVEIELKASAAR
ncbi:MAG: cupin domain-containing protein [Aquamicrobium sp.]|uniref:cupin domain-containing protein n=1 Tax=Aquamicrobium sp. TaxID=1872579 RepID=UPI00349EA032|nr:cupin domain-containing protein [Aquamicrobium sp.]MCO5155909.1 cupin domain-containing protein [Aquamicrobium sp.]